MLNRDLAVRMGYLCVMLLLLWTISHTTHEIKKYPDTSIPTDQLIVEIHTFDNGYDRTLDKIHTKIPKSWQELFPFNLHDPGSKTRNRRRAAYLLGKRSGPEVVQALTDALRDPDFEVRLAALNSLRFKGPEARYAVPKVIPLALDANQQLAVNAFLCLIAMGHDDARVVDHLAQLLEHQNPRTRSFAFGGLLVLDFEDPVLTQKLLDRWDGFAPSEKTDVLSDCSLMSNGFGFIGNNNLQISSYGAMIRYFEPSPYHHLPNTSVLFQSILLSAIKDPNILVSEAGLDHLHRLGDRIPEAFSQIIKYLEEPIVEQWVEEDPMLRYRPAGLPGPIDRSPFLIRRNMRPMVLRSLRNVSAVDPKSIEPLIPSLIAICDSGEPSDFQLDLLGFCSGFGNKEWRLERLRAWLMESRSKKDHDMTYECLIRLWHSGDRDPSLAVALVREWSAEESFSHQKLLKVIYMIHDSYPDHPEFLMELRNLMDHFKHVVRIVAKKILMGQKD